MRAPPPRAGHPPRVQARRHVRRGVLDADRVHVLDLRGRVRGRADRPEEGDRAGRRPEPHRAGHRVRLLLRARGDGAARRRITRRSWSTAIRRPSPPTTTLRTGLYFEPVTLEDVLEIVHVEKPLGRDRPVRRPDAAQAGARPREERRADHRHHAGHDRHGGGPRALPADAAPAAAASSRPTARRAPRKRR